MPRARKGAARHQRKKRILKQAKGYRSVRSKLWRTAREAVVRAGVSARRDRRRKKREYRGLWITRLSAACHQRGMTYSRLINALKKANVALNRKMLSELAINDPEAFDAVVKLAQEASEQAA
jgi:large subunit ribosomal protein L20